MLETLQIYAQECWHEPATIAGTRNALIELRKLIDKALAVQGEQPVCTVSADFFPSDGEGYSVDVVLVEKEEYMPRKAWYTDREMLPRDNE